MTSSDDLITAATTAKILGHSPRTVKRMAERGDLPFEHKLAGTSDGFLFSLPTIKAIALAKAEEARQRAETAVSA